MIKWRQWYMKDMKTYVPNDKIVNWGRVGWKEQDQFQRYKWENVLWKLIHFYLTRDEDEYMIEWMWMDIFFNKWINLSFENIDFTFINEDYQVEHMFWSCFVEAQYIQDLKVQPWTLRLTQRQKHDFLPRRWKPLIIEKWVGKPKTRWNMFAIGGPVDVVDLEKFVMADELAKDPRMKLFLRGVWLHTWHATRAIPDNVQFMAFHIRRFRQWEKDVERARWNNRARIERRKKFMWYWNEKDHTELPDWMHRTPKIANHLKVLWYNFWVKKLHLDKEYNRRLNWNETYVWNELYFEPRNNIIEQEPFMPYYAAQFKEERLYLEKMIEMSPVLHKQRRNRLLHRDLKYNKDLDWFLDRPRIKIPTVKRVPKYKSPVYETDKNGYFYETPPEHVHKLYRGEDDFEMYKYDILCESRKDGVIRRKLFEPIEEIKQAICDEWFTNKPSPTLDEIWDPHKNHDRKMIIMKLRTDCYDPPIPKPKNPHPYLRKGQNVEKEKIRCEKLFWNRVLLDYFERKIQGENPRYKIVRNPPPPEPLLDEEIQSYRFPTSYYIRPPPRPLPLAPEEIAHARWPTSCYRRPPPRPPQFWMQNAKKDIKQIHNELRRFREDGPIPEPEWDYESEWQAWIGNTEGRKERHAQAYRDYDSAMAAGNKIRARMRWEHGRYPYYKKITNFGCVSHVFRMKSQACSYTAARILNGPDYIMEGRRRPCELNVNEFMKNLDTDDMPLLSEKARVLVGWMNRQTAAADDILKRINLPDAGQAWNTERKLKRVSNETPPP